jgi:hypothetical protein
LGVLFCKVCFLPKKVRHLTYPFRLAVSECFSVPKTLTMEEIDGEELVYCIYKMLLSHGGHVLPSFLLVTEVWGRGETLVPLLATAS